MTLDDFIAKWNGKYVDTDNAYGAQCMDLMHQYCVEMLGLSQADLAAPSAHDVYVNFPNVPGSEHFDKIDNSPTGVPQEGDIIFWVNAPYGHVAIFHDGDANSFKSFDQNYPTGSPCHIQAHTYVNVGGWLRFKGIQNVQTQLDQLRQERDQNWNYFKAVCDALKVETHVDVAVAEATKFITLNDTLIQKDKQIIDIQKQASDLQTQLTLKEQAITEVSAQVATLTVAVADAQKTIDSLTKQTKDDQIQLADLQQASKIYSGLTGFRKWIFDHFIR